MQNSIEGKPAEKPGQAKVGGENSHLRAKIVVSAGSLRNIGLAPNDRVKPPPREAQQEGGSTCSAVGLNA